jgi:hypothetical protein
MSHPDLNNSLSHSSTHQAKNSKACAKGVGYREDSVGARWFDPSPGSRCSGNGETCIIDAVCSIGLYGCHFSVAEAV